ncbi:DUF1697 domain-containing protein [Lacticaseibacillus kribbianus]|uniref:DUF1697 domain-containing protein n=1 Tax=Lacticaseibacillus kribbianus TaxID=2926292 RepID=UPI001CD65F90|nr:DUF1697 domain-containing protein [Lacticaseibacillus kribbianus]
MEHLLLLRGVNVGGNHRVVMRELTAALTAAGAKNVVSYINSGNVLMDCDGDAAALVAPVLAAYDFPIAFSVVTGAAFVAAVGQAPAWWGAPGDLRHNALFRLPGYRPEYDARILAGLTAYDQVAITPQLIFWTSPAKANYSRAFYAKMLPEPFYPLVSIRNRNTTLKLAAMMRDRLD